MRRMMLVEIPCGDEHHCGGCQHGDAGECWAFIDEVGEPTELLMSDEGSVRHEVCLRAERAAAVAVDTATDAMWVSLEFRKRHVAECRSMGNDKLANESDGRLKRLVADMRLLGIEVPE